MDQIQNAKISAFNQLIASKIKILFAYVCVYCVYLLEYVDTYIHHIFWKYVHIFTCIYLYAYKLYHI